MPSRHNPQPETDNDGPWKIGDPIPKQDWDSVRNLIYAGFGRRRVARMLNLHESLVGEVFDQLAPGRHPNISEESRARILHMIGKGACLDDIAADRGISVATARIYVKSLGIMPRTVTAKYLSKND